MVSTEKINIKIRKIRIHLSESLFFLADLNDLIPTVRGYFLSRFFDINTDKKYFKKAMDKTKIET
ncbi:hypothetical protein, partial [Enterococcus faecium]|uniref:hypothetical protein n=1 Tax=Enterococcus faecium TaxID=1352 RepID=UPI0034E975B3